MTKNNILVSGASGLVGYGILKSLEGFNRIGTTVYDFSVAPKFCETVEKVLPTDDSGYLNNLTNVIFEHRVDMIIPSIECDLYKWNTYRKILKAQTFPLLNNPDLIDLCSDKWIFYKKLKSERQEYAIPTIEGTDYTAFKFPYLFKPRHGFGSKGITRIKSKEDEFYCRCVGTDFITQPIIGSDNEEYTVSGFFDLDSNLIDYFSLKRRLINGSTGEAEVADRDFGEILTDLAKIFKPVGPTNFQFRFDGDEPKLLEINPRISSATSIRVLFGYNEARMSIDYFLEGKLPEVKKKPIGRRVIRYIEDYIL